MLDCQLFLALDMHSIQVNVPGSNMISWHIEPCTSPMALPSLSYSKTHKDNPVCASLSDCIFGFALYLNEAVGPTGKPDRLLLAHLLLITVLEC